MSELSDILKNQANIMIAEFLSFGLDLLLYNWNSSFKITPGAGKTISNLPFEDADTKDPSISWVTYENCELEAEITS